MCSKRFFINKFLYKHATWDPGTKDSIPWIELEKLPRGIYAPITNPTAAETIPENADNAEDFLKNDTIIIIKIVLDAQPKIVTKYRNSIVLKPRYKLPIELSTMRPIVKIDDVIKNVFKNAPVKYASTTIYPLIGEEL